MYFRPWSSGLTISQSDERERVQKRALRMISYPKFDHYCEPLELFKLETLNDRRVSILTRFGKCLLTSARHRQFLPLTRNVMSGRNLRNAQKLHTPRTRNTEIQPIYHTALIGKRKQVTKVTFLVKEQNVSVIYTDVNGIS